jgi:hypothetical protein
MYWVLAAVCVSTPVVPLLMSCGIVQVPPLQALYAAVKSRPMLKPVLLVQLTVMVSLA